MSVAYLAKQLEEAVPAAAASLSTVVRLNGLGAEIAISPFYEPVSIMDLDDKGIGRHVNLAGVTPQSKCWRPQSSSRLSPCTRG